METLMMDDGDVVKKAENSRKRRLSEDDANPPAKFLIEEDERRSLLSLSDEIVLEICKFLDNNSLVDLGRTCTRLWNLIGDRRLWRHIDLLSTPLPLNEINTRLRHMNQETTSIKIRGSISKQPLTSWDNVTVSAKLLSKIAEKCPNLDSFAIYEGFLNLEKVSIADFPPTLTKLIFNRCTVGLYKVPNVFFTRIDTFLKNLTELVLEQCNWFETHDLVVFSKLPNLKKLSLKGCLSLTECVPYGSIATRFGFKKLEYLDVRDTPISDSDIQCFNITLTLKTILMECPEHLRETPEGAKANSRLNERTTAVAPDMPEAGGRLLRRPPCEAENLIEIILHDRSVINAPQRNGNDGQPQQEQQAEGQQQQQQQQQQPAQQSRAQQVQQIHIIHDNVDNQRIDPARLAPFIHRAISRSLWFERNFPPPFSPPRAFLISDRGICSFGFPRNPVQRGVVWIRAEARPPDTYVEKLVIRHYKAVTDVSLNHLAQCTPNLAYLDITGTSVTEVGVRSFKDEKPNCYIVSDVYTG